MLILVMLGLCMAGCAVTSVEPSVLDVVYDVETVDQPPELIGKLYEYVRRIEYPELCRKAGVQGRLTVEYVVSRQGEVEDPVIIEGVSACEPLNDEALRWIKLLKYRPGRHQGKTVRVRLSEQVGFRLG